MQDKSPQDFRRKVTRNLLFKFYGLAIVIPIFLFAICYVLAELLEKELSKDNWIDLLFLTWLATLICLGLYALRNARYRNVYRKHKTREDSPE